MKEESNKEVILYGVSALIVLVLHYFFLAGTKMHPTLQLLVSFVVFTLIMGFISIFIEWRKERKN